MPGPRVVGLQTDVTDPAAVARLIVDAEAAIGRIDILVNAHGYVPNCPLLDVDVEEWDRTFDVNVKGTMLTCQAGPIGSCRSGAAVPYQC